MNTELQKQETNKQVIAEPVHPSVIEPEELTKSISALTVDDLIKIIDKRTVQIVATLEKRDYRARVEIANDTTQIPDALTAAINIDYTKNNDYGFNRSLDVVGFLTGAQVWKNKFTRFITAHAELKDWQHRLIEDEEGNMIEVPVDLAKVLTEEERSVMLSFEGRQIEQHAKLIRAGAGLIPEESLVQRGFARWFGRKTIKKSDMEEL